MTTVRLDLTKLSLNLPQGPTGWKSARERRVPARFAITVGDALAEDSPFIPGWAFNASTGGLGVYLPTTCAFELGDQVHVRCNGLLDVYASVVWRGRRTVLNHRGEEAISLGFEFLEGQNLGELMRLVAGHKPAVLLVSDKQDNESLVARATRSNYQILGANAQEPALQLIDENEIAILIVDLLTSGMSAERLLNEIDARFPQNNIVRIALTDYTDPDSIREFLKRQRLFYFLQKPVTERDMAAVIGAGADEYYRLIRRKEGAGFVDDGDVAQRVLEHSRRLAIQRDLPSAAQAATEAIYDLLEAERAYCHVYDPNSQMLWQRSEDGDERHHPASAGLTGFVARTGRTINLPAAADSRYVKAIDDPDGGTGTEPFLAVAVQSPDRQPLAVLSAVREANSEAFSDSDAEALTALATQGASAFSQAHLQANVEGAQTAVPISATFRPDAYMEAYGDRGKVGEVLRVSPAWTRGVYWVIVGLFVAAALFAVFGRISEVTKGPAVIMAENQTSLTARAAGTVDRVPVKPGQRVAEGQRLVELYAADEAAELTRIDKEFRIQLARSLQSPGDKQARAQLAALRTQRDLARTQLEERILRAPKDGTVSDVRVRGGQVVTPGTPLVSFMDDDSRYYLVAMINGEQRPLLRPGMPIKLELAGYRYAYMTLYVESVSDEILGPEEARGYLGSSISEAMGLTHPVAVVRARLEGSTFTARGEKLTLHPGMLGSAELKLRSRRIVSLLIPGLDNL